MSTRNRAIAIILIVILSMSAVFIASIIYEAGLSSRERINHHKEAISYLLESEYKRMQQEYVSRINGFIASNNDVIHAFTDRDRPLLISRLEKRFSTFRNENPDFYDMIFILPDGTLFLSMNDRMHYGANLKVHQYVREMADTDLINGFMIAGGELIYHTVKNINVNGAKIGILEFRVRTSAMNKVFKDVLGAEYGLTVKGRSNLMKDATILDDNSNIFRNIPGNFDISRPVQTLKRGGLTYVIFSKELFDYKGQHLGYYLTSSDITAYRKRLSNMFMLITGITGAMTILSVAVLYTGFGAMLKQIETTNTNLESLVEERTKELNEAKENAIQQNKTISALFRRFKSMFSDHHAVMLLIDPKNGHIVDANSAAKKFLNSNDTDITKLLITDICTMPDMDVFTVLKKASEEGIKDYLCKFNINGRIMDMQLQISPIEIDRYKLLFTICNDVTHKIRIENELKELNKSLAQKVKEESEKLRSQELLLIQQSKMTAAGDILSAIIHQWKQPITALSYLLQDIADSAERGGTDSSYIVNASGEALAQINYMTKTVDDFRRFLMPSNVKEEFNIVECIAETIKMFFKQLEKDSIELNFTTINTVRQSSYCGLDDIKNFEMPEIDCSCLKSYGYPNEFKQVFLNIVNNARDALNSKGVENKKINILVSCQQEHIEITVSDNAGGIDEKIIERIFEPYFTTKEAKGTGIGLYMAKNIIEDHMHGSIRADNTKDGAIFTIMLKRYQSP